MSSIEQVYNEIINNNNSNSSFNDIDEIINLLRSNLSSFIDYDEYNRMMKYLKMKLDGREKSLNSMINDCFDIKCTDELTFKFEISNLMLGSHYEYVIFNKDLLKYTNKTPNLYIFNYFVFKNEDVKWDENFLSQRLIELKNRNQKENMAFHALPMNEDTLENDLLKYMWKFRNE